MPLAVSGGPGHGWSGGRRGGGTSFEQTTLQLGHSGDFGNAAKMVGKMSKSVMQLREVAK